MKISNDDINEFLHTKHAAIEITSNHMKKSIALSPLNFTFINFDLRYFSNAEFNYLRLFHTRAIHNR